MQVMLYLFGHRRCTIAFSVQASALHASDMAIASSIGAWLFPTDLNTSWTYSSSSIAAYVWLKQFFACFRRGSGR